VGEQATAVTVGPRHRAVHRVEPGGGEQAGVVVGVHQCDALRRGGQAEAGPELGGQFVDDVEPGGAEQQRRRGKGRAGRQQCGLVTARGDLPGQERPVEGGDPLQLVTGDVEVDEDLHLGETAGEIDLGPGGPREEGVGQVGDGGKGRAGSGALRRHGRPF
jgi:hypothetical protein